MNTAHVHGQDELPPAEACIQRAKWAALVDDTSLPMPQRLVSVSVIKDQAEISWSLCSFAITTPLKMSSSETMTRSISPREMSSTASGHARCSPAAPASLSRNGPSSLTTVLR